MPERAQQTVTALGKLLRTTAFKLSLAYLTVFALFAAVLIGYFAWTTSRLITQQITETIDAEINGLTELYSQGGIRRLVLIVDARSRRPGSNLYLVTTPAGEGLAGNVGTLQPGVLDQPGLTETTLPPARRGGGSASTTRWCAWCGCPAASACWSGATSRSASGSTTSSLSTARWSVAVVVVLGLIGGFFVARRVLKRIDAMTGTTRTIMEGDLSGRLPIAGTGDELDRLAENLNAMLERIEALLHGLQGGVRQHRARSANAAHAAAQPRRGGAARAPGSEADYRAALENVLEESDGLIRTFNALLMIARAESGEAGDDMAEFDAAEIVHDVAELYEPLADEKGLALKTDVQGPTPVRGNRELISQALANLIDNAIKYAAPKHAAAALAPASRT